MEKENLGTVILNKMEERKILAIKSPLIITNSIRNFKHRCRELTGTSPILINNIDKLYGINISKNTIYIENDSYEMVDYFLMMELIKMQKTILKFVGKIL